MSTINDEATTGGGPNTEAWSLEHTEVLRAWAEKSWGMSWMHERASTHFSIQNDRLTYPSIVMSSLAGLGGFGLAGSTTVASSGLLYAMGVVNLASAVLISFSKFIRAAEQAEAHHRVSVQFASFFRRVSLELSFRPADRQPCGEFTKMCRASYDRLMNGAPSLPPHIVESYMESFPTTRNMPDVAALHPGRVRVYRPKGAVAMQNAFGVMRNLYRWRAAAATSRQSRDIDLETAGGPPATTPSDATSEAGDGDMTGRSVTKK